MSTQPSTRNYTEKETDTTIQRQAAKLPSDAFIYAAGASIAVSLTLKLMRRDKDAVFVGQWAPTFLLLGIFNKLVKLFGTESRRA
ncbi:MAG: hypothetical protein H0X66_08905 [Verrucomicrobia bacterium]|nr:hypothetical protein [Verrucomicrobiota bacterium]